MPPHFKRLLRARLSETPMTAPVFAAPARAPIPALRTSGQKTTTFNDRPVRRVRYMPDGTVMLKLYEPRPNRRARHLRLSLVQWLARRGIDLLESHATPRAQARQLARRRYG